MHRIEISLKTHLPDARGLGLVKDITDLGIKAVSGARVIDVYWLDADLARDDMELICQRLLADPVTQDYRHTTPGSARNKVKVDGKSHRVEVAYNAGVTDPVEETVMKAVRDLGITGVRAVKTAKLYLLEGVLTDEQVEVICSRLLVNPIIQHVVKSGQFGFPENPRYEFKLNEVKLLGQDNAGLAKVRQQFGFNEDEFQAIVSYFQQLGRNPTDVELETLAQTWSEHCVHKTFKGRISFNGAVIDNLLKSTIMKATAELNKPWCLSVFEDNAGVIDFDGRWALCFKVETHNHPSAVEPYGGAATGIGGVIRDPLGTGLGAKPILNTDVFCFGPPD
ncbi:MAG TPA: phosphoribosylformylglycinamidine synthase subunit PurS, partial [Dehalococcoidales bacterium]